MDFSLVIGIIVGFAALLAGFILEKGVIQSLFLLSPLIIVMGGTIGAVLASFSMPDILQSLKSVSKSFKNPHSDSTEKIISKISMISDRFRREGIVCLEELAKDTDLQTEEYLLLKEGLILIQDQKEADAIQYTLDSDIRAFVQQKTIEVSIFEAAGGFSPTMGIIGTVMGLILVLAAGFDNPQELASSIATAFVSTLYGVSFANLIYIPIANKLKFIMKRKQIQKEMIVDGVCMIAMGTTLRNVENELSLYYQAFSDGSKFYRRGISN